MNKYFIPPLTPTFLTLLKDYGNFVDDLFPTS